MDAEYEGDAVGASPSEFPSPTPPNDRMFWSTIRTSAVVMARTGTERLGSKRWVRITPNHAYAQLSPPQRATALIALSEEFSGSLPTIRGECTVSLLGTGTVVFILRAVQGPHWEGDALGAVSFESTEQSTRVTYLTPANVRARNGASSGAVQGTFLTNYELGSVVKLWWSVDQGARKLELRVDPPGPLVSVQFDEATASGVPLTPVRRMMLSIELEGAATDLALFLDDVLIREL
jgi:hypothetical protein